MNEELFRLLFAGPRACASGDAVMQAKARRDRPDVRRTWILFGDPTMTAALSLAAARSASRRPRVTKPAAGWTCGSPASGRPTRRGAVVCGQCSHERAVAKAGVRPAAPGTGRSPSDAGRTSPSARSPPPGRGGRSRSRRSPRRPCGSPRGPRGRRPSGRSRAERWRGCARGPRRRRPCRARRRPRSTQTSSHSTTALTNSRSPAATASATSALARRDWRGSSWVR